MSSATAGSPARTRTGPSRVFGRLRSDLIDPTIAAASRPHRQTHRRRQRSSSSAASSTRCTARSKSRTAMVERNAGVPQDKRIEFRVGIHVGDVVEESDGDLMGDGVNIAARLGGNCEAWRDLSFRGRLSAGERQARDGGHRSRPDPTQEHRPADSRLFAAGGRPCTGEAGETGGARDARSAHAAEEAFRARAARRSARGAAGCDRGRRLVLPQCEPARQRRRTRLRRSRPSVFPSSCCPSPISRRSGARLPRRRAHR